MANEKIVNRENLKAFRQAFQEKLENGQIVPKLAKNLQNVSTESGSVQETPFIYQGTGTANGTLTVDTSDWGKHLEKQGNSVVVNQLFTGFTNTSSHSVTLTASNNGKKATLSGTSDGYPVFAYQFGTTLPAGTKLYISMKITNPNNVGFGYRIRSSSETDYDGNSQLQIYTLTKACDRIQFYGSTGIDYTDVVIENVIISSLTQWFNGDIPQDLLDHPENASRYGITSDLAYSTGTLSDSNGRYLVCGGRNVWDETTKTGYYGTSTGNYNSDNTRLCSNDFIRVIPHTNCYRDGGTSGDYICEYDKDKRFIRTLTSRQFTTSANAEYITITFGSSYGTTYHNDITISLYYSTGEGYDKYYAYEQPKIYDTGSEVLRSAGSVKDYKEPNGTIHRLVGTYTFTGQESWVSHGQGYRCEPFATGQNAKVLANQNDVPTWLSSDTGLNAVSPHNIYNGNATGISVNGSNILVSSTTGLVGKTIHYGLGYPTTEQGTPFPENIEINDYGTMGWYSSYTDYSTNTPVVIPQGCKIFYPADISLFVDSLGQRTDIDWDANKIASTTQLASETTNRTNYDTILQNAIGGTLRQLLASSQSIDFLNTDVVDLGDLSWGLSGTRFYASLSNAQPNDKACVCTKYKGVSFNARNYSIMKTCFVSLNDQIINVITDEYTDTTTFKNAMKGVLLAYEKAS